MDEPVLDKSAQGGLSKKATKTSILVLDRTTGALEVLLLLYRRDSCSKTAIRRALPLGKKLSGTLWTRSKRSNLSRWKPRASFPSVAHIDLLVLA